MATNGRRRHRELPGLDQPLSSRWSLRPSVDPETVGKMSERIARFLGSWRFIGWMTAFVAAWVMWNLLMPEPLRFDQWQFIGLTLLLSLQASYAAPLILLAQNRQADRDRVQYTEDRDRSTRIVADVEYVARELASLRLAIGELATRDFLRSELRELRELHDRMVSMEAELSVHDPADPSAESSDS